MFAEIKTELQEALALAKTEDEKVQIKRRGDSNGDSNNKNNKTTEAMNLKKES